MVVPIDGLIINGNIDPRSKEVGYMCLVKSNHVHNFFHWFNEKITYTMVYTIRRIFNPLSTSDAGEGKIPMDQYVYMWGDSDIPYL